MLSPYACPVVVIYYAYSCLYLPHIPIGIGTREPCRGLPHTMRTHLSCYLLTRHDPRSYSSYTSCVPSTRMLLMQPRVRPTTTILTNSKPCRGSPFVSLPYQLVHLPHVVFSARGAGVSLPFLSSIYTLGWASSIYTLGWASSIYTLGWASSIYTLGWASSNIHIGMGKGAMSWCLACPAGLPCSPLSPPLRGGGGRRVANRYYPH